MNAELLELKHRFGISFAPTQTRPIDQNLVHRIAINDAMVTAPNNGVPAWFLSYYDPEVVKVLTKPYRANTILPPVKKGSFEDSVAEFNLIELTNHASDYSDFANEADQELNLNILMRQTARFQAMAQYGDLQQGQFAKAQIDYHREKQMAAVDSLKRALNANWFFGAAGKQNYGLLNDPSLPAPITPASIGSGPASVTWQEKSALPNGGNYIYQDILALYQKLVEQSGELVDKDSALTLCLSSTIESFMGTRTEYGISAREMVLKEFPYLSIKTAPEYSSAAGQLVQLIATEVEGKKTAFLGYSELLRSFGAVRQTSSIEEKYAAAGWGAIIRYPFAISQMLGV